MGLTAVVAILSWRVVCWISQSLLMCVRIRINKKIRRRRRRDINRRMKIKIGYVRS